MTTILETRELCKRFGRLVVTDHCSLSVADGETHAVIGPNGAGKTTLIAQLSGALPCDEGEVWFAGRNVTGLTMHARVAMGLVRSYQITSLFPGLTVRENLALAVQARSGSSMRFWRPVREEIAQGREAERIGVELGLGARLDTPASRLAHGEQRQLEVGLALATQPRLLLLDEPMAGLGPEESLRMIDLLGTLRGRRALLLVEHDMDAVFRLADRVSVLVAGRVIATGTPADVRDNPDVRQAYLGDEWALIA
jgi:branched-chain amino acid transport system ATP-binding protein